MSNYNPQQGGYQPANNSQPDDALVELLSKAMLRAEQERASLHAAQQPAAQPKEDDDAREIDLVALFWHIMGKIHWVIIAAIVGALIAGIYAFFIRVPVYSATSKLYILSSSNTLLQYADIQIGSALTNDYQEIFKTWEVHEMVQSSLNLDYDYTYLQNHLTVTNPASTRILYITYQDTNPELAMRISNQYAKAAQEFITRSMDTQEPNSFSTALTPSKATGRSKTTYVIIGFLLGAVIVLALIVALFLLDDRPRTPDEITRVTDLPVLAVVPKQEKESRSRASSTHHHSSGSSHHAGGSK